MSEPQVIPQYGAAAVAATVLTPALGIVDTPRERVAGATANSVMISLPRSRMGLLLLSKLCSPWMTYGCLTRRGPPTLTRSECQLHDSGPAELPNGSAERRGGAW